MLTHRKDKALRHSLYDFDQAGQTASNALQKSTLTSYGFLFLELEYFALANAKQVESWNIPTRQPKRNSSNDKLWPYSFTAELDAIPITTLSNYLRKRLEEHLPYEE